MRMGSGLERRANQAGGKQEMSERIGWGIATRPTLEDERKLWEGGGRETG